jgi:hypothetical protein
MQREYRWIGDGNQTLKYNHDEIDLFIPLLFWFKNVKNSIPSNIVPWGKLQVQIKLAELTDVVASADYGGGGLYYEPTIEFADLYVNNLYIPPEIFNLYTKKFVFNLIRVHRHHKEAIVYNSTHEYQILLNNLKWPTELLYFSFRPRNNLSMSQYWYKSCQLVKKEYKVPVVAKNENTVISGTILTADSVSGVGSAILISGALASIDNIYDIYDFIITGGSGYNSLDITKNRYIVDTYDGATKKIVLTTDWTGAMPNTTTTYDLFTPQLAINLVTYYKENPVVDTVSLSSHGIDLFRTNSEAFYNYYTPYRYGSNINTPCDRGQYFLSFCLYPGNHSPSGSINLSLTRELYLNFTSRLISKDYPVDLIVMSRAINFLLVDSVSGMMGLKFSV